MLSNNWHDGTENPGFESLSRHLDKVFALCAANAGKWRDEHFSASPDCPAGFELFQPAIHKSLQLLHTLTAAGHLTASGLATLLGPQVVLL